MEHTRYKLDRKWSKGTKNLQIYEINLTWLKEYNSLWKKKNILIHIKTLTPKFQDRLNYQYTDDNVDLSENDDDSSDNDVDFLGFNANLSDIMWT